MQQHGGRSRLHSTKADTRSLKYKQAKRASTQTTAKVKAWNDTNTGNHTNKDTQGKYYHDERENDKPTVRKVQLTLVKYIFCVIFVGRQIFFQILEGERVFGFMLVAL